MLTPSKIVLHCSATPEGRDVTATQIRRWHMKRGWADIGYHFVVGIHGEIEFGRPITMQGAHVKGHNEDTIGICYVGGLDRDGNPKDTLNHAQRESIEELVTALCRTHESITELCGHRDFPGVAKACPCFDTKQKFFGLMVQLGLD